jgi:microcystin-dependent protein
MEPMMATIQLFSGNFAPRGWAFCDGQLLSINQYQALFSLLGTTYGGDGRTSFALPDLRSRVAVHPGRGPGLSTYKLGQRGGQETHILSISEMPNHTHGATLDNGTASIKISSGDGTTNNPVGNFLAKGVTPAAGPVPVNVANIYAATSDNVMAADLTGTPTVLHSGSSQGHTNIQPYEAINYIIAMVGTFPSRS